MKEKNEKTDSFFLRKEEYTGKKGFVILTKSFVKIGITKTFCHNNKMLSSVNKTFGCCSKFFFAATKILSVVPNFVAVTKPYFSVYKAEKSAVSRQAFGGSEAHWQWSWCGPSCGPWCGLWCGLWCGP